MTYINKNVDMSRSTMFKALLKGIYYSILREPMALGSLLLLIIGVGTYLILNDGVTSLILIFAGIALAGCHVFWNRK